MTDRNGTWATLERWSPTAFLVGGLLLALDSVLVSAEIITGAEHWLLLGQAFVGAGWTAALLGLLGLYPGLADRSPWSSRIGAVFAAVGVVTFATMAVAVLAYYAGIPSGEYDAIGMYFLPGVIVGSVLGFVVLGIATLRTGVRSRTVGALLLVPPLLVITNILRFVAGNESTTITLGIVVADALAILAIGYVLRSGHGSTERAESTADAPA